MMRQNLNSTKSKWHVEKVVPAGRRRPTRSNNTASKLDEWEALPVNIAICVVGESNHLMHFVWKVFDFGLYTAFTINFLIRRIAMISTMSNVLFGFPVNEHCLYKVPHSEPKYWFRLNAHDGTPKQGVMRLFVCVWSFTCRVIRYFRAFPSRKLSSEWFRLINLWMSENKVFNWKVSSICVKCAQVISSSTVYESKYLFVYFWNSRKNGRHWLWLMTILYLFFVFCGINWKLIKS